MYRGRIFKYANLLLLWSFIWSGDHFKTLKLRASFLLISYAIQTGFFLTVMSMFMASYDLYAVGDFQRLITNTTNAISYFLICMKLILYQTGNLRAIFDGVQAEERTVLVENNAKIRALYFERVRYVFRYFAAIFFMAEGTAVANVVLGAIEVSQQRRKGAVIFEARFPFDQEEYPAWAWLVKASFTIIGALYYTATQLTYLSLLEFVKMQLQILQHRFRSFGGDASIAIFKRLLNQHQELIRLMDAIDKEMRAPLLVEFVLSSFNIACGVYQMIAEDEPVKRVWCFGYLSLLLAQLFVLAWHANELRIESVAVSDAIYESAWYERDVATQKMVAIALTRAQRPSMLHVGPFRPLTTQALLTVMRAAYSYVTIMKGNK